MSATRIELAPLTQDQHLSRSYTAQKRLILSCISTSSLGGETPLFSYNADGRPEAIAMGDEGLS